MDVTQATRRYEAWMRQRIVVVAGDLREKHRQMRKDAYAFLRGSFYRWLQIWPDVCDTLTGVSRLLAVGDLHAGSFGTWRDREGRLCWGVDDFDECDQLPYTHDLVRLATSLKLLIDRGDITVTLKVACNAILDGYRQNLDQGGCPFVLAEKHTNLERLGIDAFEPPRHLWEDVESLPRMRSRVPPGLRATFQRALPDRRLPYTLLRRHAGLGSLGQQRFVALAQWNGGLIAREAKAVLPSAQAWLDGKGRESRYARAMSQAIRSSDPCHHVVGRWIVRRLAPDANPIDIDDLPKRRDEERLIHAMGVEAANVHLGSATAAAVRRFRGSLRMDRPVGTQRINVLPRGLPRGN